MRGAEPVLAAFDLADADLVELRSARRGAATWFVRCATAAFRVKLAQPTADGHPADEVSLDREATALAAIPEYAARFEPWRTPAGLRTRWVDGHPIGATPDVAACARAVEPVHRAGWVHGDLQPAHFVITGEDVVLIDFGQAHGPGIPHNSYRGGLVHCNSPELCKQILADGYGRATAQTDVYAFGASMYRALFSRFPISCPADASHADALERISTSAPDVAPLAEIPNGDVIAACLAPLERRPPDLGAVVARLDH